MSRVLKLGARLVAMEFSIPRTALIRTLYYHYSFQILPRAGRLITETAEPFHYLAESVRVFPAPEQGQKLMLENGFTQAAFERLSNRLAVIYSGKNPGPD